MIELFEEFMPGEDHGDHKKKKSPTALLKEKINAAIEDAKSELSSRKKPKDLTDEEVIKVLNGIAEDLAPKEDDDENEKGGEHESEEEEHEEKPKKHHGKKKHIKDFMPAEEPAEHEEEHDADELEK